MAYAAPAGGILCNELLHPTLYARSIPGVTKAGVVQQLSLLVGFLDWVNPLAPNGDLCASTKAVVQHVLDYTLNGSPTNPTGDVAQQGIDLNFDLATDIDMGGFFSFDLLDTYDWMRPETVPNQHIQNVD